MISIVVCTFNSANRIENCLTALVHQVNPPPHELIIVNNGSTDDTVAQIQGHLHQSKGDFDWKIVDEPKQGLIHARIAGLRLARFDWVLFCDDDNALASDFLFEAQQALKTSVRLGVLGSKGLPRFLGQRPEWFDRYASSFAVGDQQVKPSQHRPLVHVYGAGSIYWKTPLLSLFDRGFSPALQGRRGEKMSSGDDVEWCYLMQLMGYEIVYEPNLKFEHLIPTTRLSWDYYLLLKSGITDSSALLEPYKYLVSNQTQSLLGFGLSYFLKTIKVVLLYLKYNIRWKGSPHKPQDQVSFIILKARLRSYLKNYQDSLMHYRQLIKYFGS